MVDLGADAYVRQRIAPRHGEPYYLHLSDLLIALKNLIPAGASRVLDYGCGGSPYRQLLSGSVYHRADLAGGRDLDFEYSSDARLPADLANYDCVLSTQVLEHVENPETYLKECYRVLRPGGHLLLTTHGLFEDHACPYDYWRWTVFGLRRQVETTGFNVEKIMKLTTGPRGALFLAEREFYRLRFKGAGLYGQAFSMGVRVIQRLGARRLHLASDKSFPHHRVVDANESGHDIYVNIALLATR